MTGVLLVDKPAGPTSAQVVARLKRLLGARRVGHAGTLDPMASGLLLACVEEGTKLAAFLHLEEKEYAAAARLGITTTTLDAEGEITERRDASGTSLDAVRRTLNGLLGAQMQKPPMYSAVRKGGRRLYELAREGIEVEREAREIVVHQIELLGMEAAGEGAVDVRFRVACSKGTYVRALAQTLGERLGVGAHLTALRRIRSGSFRVDDAVTLDALERGAASGCAIDPAAALASMPALRVDAATARRVYQGQPLRLSELQAADGLAAQSSRPTLVRVLWEDGRLLAVARATPGGEALKVLRVFNYGLTGTRI